MARKPLKKAEQHGPDIVGQTPPDIAEVEAVMNQAEIIAAAITDERDLVNQLLGQAQMADAFAKFSVTVTTSKLAFVKENKLYQSLKGKKSGNGYQFSGTWDEFCGLLNISREKADLDIQNLRTFGEEALESMSRMGIGYRELRQFRRLPDDSKTALIEVAQSGNKDAFIDLAEELIAKHAKEKEASEAKLSDIAAELKASDRLLSEKRDEVAALKRAKAKLELRTASWDERVAPFKKEITERQSLIDEALGRHLEAIEALEAWLNTELTADPDYDPESPADMPQEIKSVLLHIADAVERTASLVGSLQFALDRRFGGDIAEARVHLMHDPDAEEAQADM